MSRTNDSAIAAKRGSIGVEEKEYRRDSMSRTNDSGNSSKERLHSC